jgi:superoxide dismutase, Cu-Zn family
MLAAKRIFPCVALVLMGLTLIGFAQSAPGRTGDMQMGMGMAPMPVGKAIAVLNPASGSQVHGTVTFERKPDGMHVTADLEGLTPGEHGFHVHEYGDCSSADAVSAGGHFNPMHMSHGAPTDKSRHEGDLGNLTADANGKAHLEWTDPMLSFSGAESILGRSVIVHANADDMKSQPAGNAGPRVACGVIGVAK